ncbi:hypothetical protein Hanom_Chr16g01463391 [Helianthus anomalus]
MINEFSVTRLRCQELLWHPRKIHSHSDLTPYCFWVTYQISGRNFFQLGDDVTSRIYEVSVV